MVSRITTGRQKEGGRLALNVQDHRAHVTGGDFRHDASMIDVTPIDGYPADTVQEQLELYADYLVDLGSQITTVETLISSLVESQINDSLASIQLQNTQTKVTVSGHSATDIGYATYNETNALWYLAADNSTVFTSIEGATWATRILNGTNAFTYAFPADGYTIFLDKTDNTVFTINSALTSSDIDQASGDKLWVGIYDPTIDKIIIAGKNGSLAASYHLVFMTKTPINILDSAMTRDASFDVNTGEATTQLKNFHIAGNDAGRVVCLVGYRDTVSLTDGRTDMFIITKNTLSASGISIAQTSNIGPTTGTGVEKSITGLAYDQLNNQWVAVTFNGEVWTSPVVGETWTKISEFDVTFFDLKIADNIWVAGGISENFMYSLDAGLSWYIWDNSNSGTVLAYSNRRKQFLMADAMDVSLTLSLGNTSNLAEEV